ncbi:hypothetical protein [Segetibacter sp. 3557_3]|uniref:hypothetical protein n=1 Tax=Segetibacter sp. 3557_3 TaxID=2547429 RepID=UPI0014054D6C|nr:hypothetical protein [Segetibacter sp. 3557_3]
MFTKRPVLPASLILAPGESWDNYSLQYPADMKVRDNLKDGSLLMELYNSRMMQTLS